MRKQRVVLEHHADVALVRRHVIEQLAVEADFAAGREFEARQHHQARGLARAGRPEQRQEFAAANVEIQRFDDERLAVVGLSHAAKTDDHIIGLHRGCPLCCATIFIEMRATIRRARFYNREPFQYSQ